jgi:phage/conjugal plasmid C-4 type zinc finger TraR family protein
MERLADSLDLAQQHIELETAASIEIILARVRHGRGSAYCTDCGEDIPAARRAQVPNAIRCVHCQTRFEFGRRTPAG